MDDLSIIKPFQFGHSLEEQIGGQINAGFALKAIYEDKDNVGLLAEYAPMYICKNPLRPNLSEMNL